MEWPADIVKEEDGKSYAEVGFSPMLCHRALDESWRTGVDNLVIVFGEEGGEGIVCQKSFLTTISGYFRSFFERWKKNPSEGEEFSCPPKVYLENVSISVFKHLIKLASTGFAEVDDECDFGKLICAANYLQMDDINQRFQNLLERQLEEKDLPTALWIYSAVDNHGHVSLLQQSKNILMRSFDSVLIFYPDQLMDFTAEQWIDFVANNNTFITKEDNLFEAVCEWVTFYDQEKEKRSLEFPGIAQNIHTGSLSKSTLSKYDNEQSPLAIRHFLQSMSGTSQSHPRTIEVLFCVTEAGQVFVDPFAERDNVVVRPFSTRKRSVRPLITSSENIVYAKCDQGDIWSFDPIEDVWKQITQCSPLTRNGRVFKAATYLDDYLYLAFYVDDEEGDEDSDSGDEASKRFKVVCVNVKTGVEEDIEELPAEAEEDHCSLVITAHDGKVFVFLDDKYVIYYSETDSWSNWIDIPAECDHYHYHACVGPMGIIYLSGQQKLDVLHILDPADYSITVDTFDPESSEWTPKKLCPGTSNWCDPIALFLQGRIILGVSNSAHADDPNFTVFAIYDEATDSWKFQNTSIFDERRRYKRQSFRGQPVNRTGVHQDETPSVVGVVVQVFPSIFNSAVVKRGTKRPLPE